MFETEVRNDMSVNLCNHRKENGALCRSPALRGREQCYFHIPKQKRDYQTLQMFVKLAMLINKQHR